MSTVRKVLGAFGIILVAGILVPAAYIEGTCRAPVAGLQPSAPYQSILPPNERRPEARTWLTYPEWHIVYSADSFGRHLAARPPSAYPYWSDVRSFWSSYCLFNRVTRGSPGAAESKVMIYTIGLSFSAEMAIKLLYENSIGRLSEWIGGWRSQDDHYAARAQQIYGAFMHQLPWYRFPFGSALAGEWRTNGEGAQIRHWERRFALSAEYGVKAGYAKLIDTATGATLGRDELSLRFVVREPPAKVAAIDPRFKIVRSARHLTVVEAPRYAQFTELLGKLARKRITLIEIAGNDDIFLTVRMPVKASEKALPGTVLLSLPLPDRPGWKRIGLSVKVPDLLPLIARVEAHGAAIEHVYDY